MLLTVTPLEDPGPPSPTPPPTAPKPSKDNARLQRLLRKAAKRSGLQQPPSQPPKSFRSTLSPVNEGDLESPEPVSPYNYVPPPLNLPPRFQIRPMTHRVPSPYPKQRSFTFTITEQQSLSQYLTSPPPLETLSPHPLGSSTPNTPIPFPEEASTHVSYTPFPITSSTPEVQLKEASYHESCLQFTPRITKSKSPCLTESPVTPIPKPENLVTMTLILPVTKQKRPGPIVSKSTEELNQVQSIRGATNTESDKCVSGNKEAVIDGCHPIETLGEPLLNKEDASDKPGSFSPTSKTVLQLELPSIEVTTENNESISLSIAGKETSSTGLTGALPSQCDVDAPRDSSSAMEATSSRTTSKVTVSLKTCHSALASLASEPPLLLKKEAGSEEMTLLKNPDRPKAPRKKPGGGWARLVKHLIVEPEEPKFPEQQQAEVTNEKRSGDTGSSTEVAPQGRSSRANKMWDALLYHMATSTKGQEKPGTEIAPQLPFLRSRLPLLLHRPRFDARKLKEAASRPLRRVTAFFCKKIGENKPPEATAFNRTASGWSLHKEATDKTEGEEGGKEENVQA